MKFKLTEGQEQAKDKIITKLLNVLNGKDKDKFMTLSGAAGTGKTTMMKEVIDYCTSRDISVYVTSTTHKATKVLRTVVQSCALREEWIKTIHSHLLLKLSRVGGKEKIESRNEKQKYFGDLLIIDECSMISDDLLGFILDCKDRCVLFVGDHCQIPPVTDEDDESNDEDSRCFTEVETMIYLTEVVRQGKDNPIISLATKIRESQTSDTFPKLETNIVDGSGVEVLDTKLWMKKFFSNIKKGESDNARIVTFTNDKVDQLNNVTRRFLYEEDGDLKDFYIGEIIVANSSSPRPQLDNYKNGEEVRIIDIEHDEYCEKYQVKYSTLTVKSLDTGDTFNLALLSRKELDSWGSRLSNVALQCKYAKNWGDFWEMKDRFDDFKYIYCITAHKSQGSTFKNTYVYTQDFVKFGKNDFIKKLLYTATTRSSNMTIFSK